MAIRYKQSFDQYIKEKGYTDIRTLVAFSGVVEDPDAPGKSWSEVGMNGGIKEHELPERFDSVEYQILLVAEKYQTGFDQPLLHTMYVDKKLSGLQAVQTLSRLNRTATGKEDTFVLDFRNKPEEIFDAFKPYYEDTPAEPLTDPQNLYRLQHQIEETRLIFDEEVKAFCAVYFLPKRKESVHDHAKMNAILDQGVERFRERPEDVGTGQGDEEIRLSELIKILNDRFGTDFTEADQLFFDQIQQEAMESDHLRQAAEANTEEDFKFVFEKAFEGLVIDRVEGNEEIFGKLMSDGDFRKMAIDHLRRKVYQSLRK